MEENSRLESFKRSGHFDLGKWLFGFFDYEREDGKEVKERQRRVRWNELGEDGREAGDGP